MKNYKKQTKEKNKNNWLPIWMCLGLSIGTVIGAGLNNIPLWMSVGLSIGVCFGVAFSNKDNK